MKKLFTLITLLAVTFGIASAQTTYVASTMSGLPSGNADFTATFDTYSLAVAKANGGTAPTYHTTYLDIRAYAKNTLTLSTTGDAFSTVVFNVSDYGLRRLTDVTASSGSVSVDVSAKTVTWTGAAVSSVVFTVGASATYGTDGSSKAGQLCFTSITITTGEGTETVVKPSFSLAAGTYYVPQTLSMSCGTADATIYYTLDGTTPTAESNVYSSALTLSATTTVKAIAVKGELTSEMTEATYTFASATSVENIAAYQQVEDATMVQFANPVTVVANNGNSLYVKDDSGYALFYGAVGRTYKHGDVIPAGFVGSKTTYNGEPELVVNSSYGFAAASENLPFDPEVITTAGVVAANFGHYVRINNTSISYYYRTLTDADGNSVTINTGLGGYSNKTDSTKVYDVFAAVGTGKNKAGEVVYCLYPITLIVSGSDVLHEVDNIAALYELESGIKGKINSDVKAIYQNGNYLYVKNEDTYALVYGKLTNKFENGNVITGAIASWTTYNGAKQLTPVDSTFVVARTDAAVEPENIPLEEVGTDMLHTYLIVKNATVEADTVAKYFKIADETLSGVTMYNRFNLTMPEELTGKTFDVTCFVSVYNNALQLYPVAIAAVGEDEPGVTGDVNGDGIVDISDVNTVINMVLGKEDKTDAADVTGDGTVDISDVNAIINIMLGK